MLKLTVINPYDPVVQYRDIKGINLDKAGVTSLTLNTSWNEPYELDITVNRNSEVWDLLRDNRNYGIRLTTDYFDLAFITFDRSQQVQGEQNFKFLSSSRKLAFSQPIKNQSNYEGSLATYISGLDSDFVFTPMGGDFNVQIDSGLLNNLEILQELSSYQFKWIEKGLKDVGGGVLKTEILYGDTDKDMLNYVDSSGDVAFTPQTITQQPGIDNFFDLNKAELDYLNENDSGDYYTHLRVFGDTGQGSAQNSIIELTDPSATYIKPSYPLVPVFNPLKGINEYWILNPFVASYPRKFKQVIYTLTGNSQDSTGLQEIDPQWARQYIYTQGVNFHRNTILNRIITYNATTKRMVLPGTPIKLIWDDRTKLLDGTIKTNLSVNDTFLANNLSFNLEEIKN